MTKAIDIATEIIKLNEGCKLEVYTCPAGYKTFGYGTNLEVLDLLFKCAGVAGADIDFSSGLDVAIEQINNTQDKEALAVAFLQSEIINCKRTLNTQKWFTDYLSEFQQAIILDLAYNIGVAGVLKFKNMIKAIEQHNYGIACEEMLDSKYHYQMICFGYQDELVDEGIINPFFKDYATKIDIIDWYNSLDNDHKKLRSMSNAVSLQFNKPLGKYKELF
jgi:lysozyme